MVRLWLQELFDAGPGLRLANERKADVAFNLHGVGVLHFHVAGVRLARFGVVDFAIVPLVALVVCEILHKHEAQSLTATQFGVGVLGIGFGLARAWVVRNGEARNSAAELVAALE